jgi:hypothetical protein
LKNLYKDMFGLYRFSLKETYCLSITITISEKGLGMLTLWHKGWNQTKRRSFLRRTVFVILTTGCLFGSCEIVFARQNPQYVARQTTNRAVQTASPARQNPQHVARQTTNRAVQADSNTRQPAVFEPMQAVPDFRDMHSADAELFAAHDRLDRNNLPMLYHFTYDEYYRADAPVVPNVALLPEPQNRNNPVDLNARLSELWKSRDGGHRAVTLTTPPLPSLPEDSQPPAAIKIRRLPAVQGIVAIDVL